MDSPVIGIKIANGTFFPILKADDTVKKRVILTPVAPEQTDVKIDIFRGEGDAMFNPVYVASLILNNIKSDTENGPEIELLIGMSETDILDAEAFEKFSGEKQFLSISLDAIDETDYFEMPEEEENTPFFNAEIRETDDFDSSSLEGEDFSLDDDFPSLDDDLEDAADFGDGESDDFSGGMEEDRSIDESSLLYDSGRNKGDRKIPALKLAVVFLSIVFLIFLVLLVYTIIKKPALAEEEIREEVKKEVVAEKETVKKEPPVIVPAEAEKKNETPAAVKKEPDKTVVMPPVKESPAVKSVRYKIKKGDTLWDISASYYRTPWKYKKIAKDNNIKNPDLIYAGSYLNIKEQ